MKIDIAGTTFELAEMIKQDQGLIEKDLFKEGNEVLALFMDPQYKDSFKNLREMKIELFRMALEDLAMGAITLKTSSIGLAHLNGQIKTYITPFGSPSQTNVMCSISLKSVAAFKSWRAGEDQELPQEELNAAIYCLAVHLAKFI